jgi:GxxExxY protein
MEVHRELGHGFLEAVYQEAFANELRRRDIPFRKECPIPVNYKGDALETNYRADFVCFGEVLVELKALGQLSGIEEAQVINYLKATGLKKALLINFGTSKLEFKRIVLNL